MSLMRAASAVGRLSGLLMKHVDICIVFHGYRTKLEPESGEDKASARGHFSWKIP